MFQCVDCDFYTFYNRIFKKHSRLHQRMLCTLCSVYCKSKAKLVEHIQSAHPPVIKKTAVSTPPRRRSPSPVLLKRAASPPPRRRRSLDPVTRRKAASPPPRRRQDSIPMRRPRSRPHPYMRRPVWKPARDPKPTPVRKVESVAVAVAKPRSPSPSFDELDPLGLLLTPEHIQL